LHILRQEIDHDFFRPFCRLKIDWNFGMATRGAFCQNILQFMTTSEDPLVEVLERIAAALEAIVKRHPERTPGASHQPCAGAAVVHAMPQKLLQHLFHAGLRVEKLPDALPVDPALDTVAFLLGEQIKSLRPLLLAMHKAVPPSFEFKAIVDDKQTTLARSLLTQLKVLGLIRDFSYQSIAHTLKGQRSGSEEAARFFGSGWIERYLRAAIRRFLNLDKTPVEMLHDLRVVDDAGAASTLDTLLAVGDTIYYWDAELDVPQDGACAERKRIAGLLRLPADRLFLVVGTQLNDAARSELAESTGFTILSMPEMLEKIEEIERAHAPG
jgi:hypothetical protein